MTIRVPREAARVGLGLAALCLPPPAAADAHAVAGARFFPVTLTLDDPGVADEASLPTVTHIRHAADDNGPGSSETDVGGEYDKRITKDLGVAINETWIHLGNDGGPNADGFTNLVTTLKYHVFTDAAHEATASFGLIKEWGGTGAARVGADRYGSLTPTLYFGKGFGDLPDDGFKWARPLALTGTFGYQFAEEPTRSTFTPNPPGGGPTGVAPPLQSPSGALSFDHSPNLYVWGVAVQYSLPYLNAAVEAVDAPAWVTRFTPLVEFAFVTPATEGYGRKTQGTIAPGLIYSSQSYQIGVEALVPANRQSGKTVGVIAQAHLFLDDIFPQSLGTPLFGE